MAVIGTKPTSAAYAAQSIFTGPWAFVAGFFAQSSCASRGHLNKRLYRQVWHEHLSTIQLFAGKRDIQNVANLTLCLGDVHLGRNSLVLH